MSLQIGDTAPNFSGQDVVNNVPFNMADHSGSVILLAFSGITWCGPCIFEAPHLQTLWQEFTSGPTNPPVKFILVSTKFGEGEPLGALQTQIQNFGITFPVIHGHNDADDIYDISAVPTLYFINTSGTICGLHIGASPPAEELMDAIRQELYHCGANPPLNIFGREWVAVATILFGVTSDGGGLTIVGGKPVPVGPWDPLRRLGAHGRDVLRSLAAAELASGLEDAQVRSDVRDAALKSVVESARQLQKSPSRALSVLHEVKPGAGVASLRATGGGGGPRILGETSTRETVGAGAKKQKR